MLTLGQLTSDLLFPQSIDAMKNLVTEAPPTSLQPAIFANLAAAYELESGQSAAKKLTFLPLLANHVSEGFQLQALNIRWSINRVILFVLVRQLNNKWHYLNTLLLTDWHSGMLQYT